MRKHFGGQVINSHIYLLILFLLCFDQWLFHVPNPWLPFFQPFVCSHYSRFRLYFAWGKLYDEIGCKKDEIEWKRSPFSAKKFQQDEIEWKKDEIECNKIKIFNRFKNRTKLNDKRTKKSEKLYIVFGYILVNCSVLFTPIYFNFRVFPSNLLNYPSFSLLCFIWIRIIVSLNDILVFISEVYILLIMNLITSKLFFIYRKISGQKFIS